MHRHAECVHRHGPRHPRAYPCTCVGIACRHSHTQRHVSAQSPRPTHTRTTYFSLVWVQGQCQVGCAQCPSCARPPRGQWFLGSVWQGPPMCPQVTSSCCSAPPSSGRYSQLRAPKNGSTWPASTPTTWSHCGGSPTLCPTSSTAGGSQGIASLQSPVRAGGSLGPCRQLVSRADRHTWALASTEPWTGAASGVLWPGRGVDTDLTVEGPSGIPLA